MEEENRNQKLKAGKEKLAQFQRKKRKKKSGGQDDGDKVFGEEQANAADVQAPIDDAIEHLETPVERRVDDVLSQSSEKSMDSLTDNDLLPQHQPNNMSSNFQYSNCENNQQDERIPQEEMPNASVISKSVNQSVTVNGEEENKSMSAGVQHNVMMNGDGSQEFSVNDVKELMYHIQWLQTQLRQSNSTLMCQTEQQKSTYLALEKANSEITSLKNSILEKDNLMGHLAEKLTQISREYSGLKKSYAKLQNSSQPGESIKDEEHVKEEKNLTVSAEVKKLAVGGSEDFLALKTEHEVAIKGISEKYEEIINEAQTHSQTLKLENERLQTVADELMTQNEVLTEKCDTLTKGLTFMKEEHEKSLKELSDLNRDIQNLKQEHEMLTAYKAECEGTILGLNSDLKMHIEGKDHLQIEVEKLTKYTEQLKEQLRESTVKLTDLNTENENTNTECKVLLEKLETGQNEISLLKDENMKILEDNNSYKIQVATFEAKLSESRDVINENGSLRVQNDDLKNRLNDQKDVIASLKAEMDVITEENKTFRQKLNEIGGNFQQFERANLELLEEKDNFLQKLEGLKEQLVSVKKENMELKNTNLALEVKVENLKLDLNKSVPDSSELPISMTDQGNDNEDIRDTCKEHKVEGEIEICFEPTLNSESVTPLKTVQDDSNNADLPFVGLADTSWSEPANQTISNDTGLKSLESDQCDINAELLVRETQSSVANDTAYDSLRPDTVSDDSNNEILRVENSCLKEAIERLQLEANTVCETLCQKINECEKCHEEIETLRRVGRVQQMSCVPLPESESGLDIVFNDSCNLEKEVSNVHSAHAALEKEVNMHASSSPTCHTSHVVTLASSSLGNVVTGDPGDSVIVHVGDVHDEDTFQGKAVVMENPDEMHGPALDNKSAVGFENSGKGNKALVGIDQLDDKIPNENSALEQPKSSVDGTVESSVIDVDDTSSEQGEDEANLVKTFEFFRESEQALQKELSSVKMINEKLVKDGDNTLVTVERLQTDLKKAEEQLVSVRAELEHQTCQCEKVTTEKNKLENMAVEFESQINELKEANCDIAVQKEQFLEELDRVKERLAYLESSEDDVLEIKEMLDSIEEEREELKKENENLQCSLSSQLDENERLIATLDALHKENSVLLENVKRITDESAELKDELKVVQNKKIELEDEIETVIKCRDVETVKLNGEIDGLLEENSTLKTNVQIKDSEIENLKTEIVRLKSFIPKIESVASDVNVLTSEKCVLEKKLEEVSKDNENLVSELIDIQKRISESADENEQLFDKCEEYQNIISQLDNEKTELLELIEQLKEEHTVKSQEYLALTEKYEMQLESLDQENSTLKTKLALLEDECHVKDSIEKDNLILNQENTDSKLKICTLEEEIKSLRDQLNMHQKAFSEQSANMENIEAQSKSLLEENNSLDIQCSHLKQEMNACLQNENYLKEQLKIFEETTKSGKENSSRLERLNEQLELEKKYKTKLQNDIEQLYLKLERLEEVNRCLVDGKGKSAQELAKFKEISDKLEKELKHKNEDIMNLECNHNTVKTNYQQLKNEMKTNLAENDQLKSELKEANTSLQFISSNRDHLRTQIEILASEIERLSEHNDQLTLQNRDKDIYFRKMQCENDMLNQTLEAAEEDLHLYKTDNDNLTEEIKMLQDKVESLNCKTEQGAQNGNEDLVADNQNLKAEIEKIKEQNELLRNTNQESLQIDEQIVSENKELSFINRALSRENEKLRSERDELQVVVSSFRERLTRLDDLMDQYRPREGEASFSERIEELNNRVVKVHKEKEELQKVTEDLTNTLHEMQTKYEEVKSEMESTKKRCDKEICELQTQLQEMSDDVHELRRMLDYMEREMTGAAEEKKALKEGLERKELEFASVVEQKEKLEAMLNVKQQKDLKNMNMASKKQTHTDNMDCSNDGAVNRAKVAYTGDSNCEDLSQDDSSLEPDAVVQLAEAISAMSESLSDLNETYEMFEETQDTETEPIIPSFESAYNLLQLRPSHDNTCHKSAQTNLSIGEFEGIGFLLDDNGEGATENKKETSLESVETQTEGFDVGEGIETEDTEITEGTPSINVMLESCTETLLNPTVSEEITEFCDTIDTTDSQCVKPPKVGEQLHCNSRDLPSFELKFVNTMCQTDTCDVVEVETQTMQMHNKPIAESHVYFETSDVMLAPNDGTSEIVACHSEIELDMNEDGILLPVLKNDLDKQHEMQEKDKADNGFGDHCASASESVRFSTSVSNDSGIMSAPVVLDDRNLYNFDVKEQEKAGPDDLNSTRHVKPREQESILEECDKTVKQEDECKQNIVDTEVQTDFDIEKEINLMVAEHLDQIKLEFNEKQTDLETEIKSKIVRGFESRESKIKEREDNYERKIKNMEFEMEERYEQKFRQREVEIVLEAERDKKAHADETEREANRRIERIKIEKDQQFVETLQKVKADFAKRNKQETRKSTKHGKQETGARSHEHAGGGSMSEIGPRGDEGSEQMHLLQLENQELASARDELLRKISATEQEQEVLYQEVLCIMGEQETMEDSSRAQRNPQLPSWLDWEMSPELSFGSVRSSIDTKSLSGSLDPSSFCSNPDCLNVKMRYEHLIEKIQQFLKMKSVSSMSTPETTFVSGADEQALDVDGERVEKEADTDRFVENKEDECQMLQRITSIHLEHCVRVPKSDKSPEKGKDQFVRENSENASLPESHDINDIINIIVGESSENVEGHFSENESDGDSTKESVGLNSMKALKSRKKEKRSKQMKERRGLSFPNDGHFSEEDESSANVAGRRRHFSDSELFQGMFEGEQDVKTSLSENNEGQFVLEHPTSAETAQSHDTTNVLSTSNNKEEQDSAFNDNVFISAEGPPGRLETFSFESDPVTGKETGDFFEEKVVKTFASTQSAEYSRTDGTAEIEDESFDSGDILEKISHDMVDAVDKELIVKMKDNHLEDSGSSPKKETANGSSKEKSPVTLPKTKFTGKGLVARSQSPRRDLVDTPALLEKDLPQNGTKFDKGKRSYENAVFDILNSICPGTDPTHKPGVRAQADSFHPVIQDLSDTATEFSDLLVETDLKELLAKYNDLKCRYNEVLQEYREYQEKKTNTESTGSVDSAVVKERLENLLHENKVLQQEKEELKDEKQILLNSLNEINVQDYEQSKKENRQLKEEIASLNDDIKFVTEEVELRANELINLQEKIRHSDTGHEDLCKQIRDLEQCKEELEKKLAKTSKDCEQMREDLKSSENDYHLLEEAKEKLTVKVAELLTENENLRLSEQKCNGLMTEQESLKNQILHLQAERNELLKMIEEDKSKLASEKDQLEKALLAHDDISRDLEGKLEEIRTENRSLNELLKNESQAKCELKEREDHLSNVVEQLKKEKDELNRELAKLRSDNDLMMEKEKKNTEDILVLKNDKDFLNRHLKKLQEENLVYHEELAIKVIKLNQLTESNETLAKQVDELSGKLRSLEPEITQLNCEIETLKIVNVGLEAKLSGHQAVHENPEKDHVLLCTGNEETLERAYESEEVNAVESIEQSQKDLTEKMLSRMENDTNEHLMSSSGHISLQLKEGEDKMTEEDDGFLEIEGTHKFKVRLESLDRSTETKDLEEEWFKHRDEEWQKRGAVKYEDLENESGSSYSISFDKPLEKLDMQDGQDILSLKEELEMLKTENVALKERIDSLDARSDSDTDLQILHDMREAIRTLKTEKDAIERQKSEVSDSLEKDQKRLQGEVEDLLSENDVLRRAMKIKEETLKLENAEILKMYNDLRNEVEVLVISKHDLEVELHALKDLLEQESAVAHDKTVVHDTSKELTLQDLEEMDELKTSIQKLKSDLKEKDSYVRKLEEHLLGSGRGVPNFASTPKPVFSRGNPLMSKALFKRTSLTNLSRKAFSHDIPRQVTVDGTTSLDEIQNDSFEPNTVMDDSIASENTFVEGIGGVNSKLTSSILSSVQGSAQLSGSLEASDRIRSGLNANEDGHLALELKQFELVAEITKLRKDLRETKAVYAQETSLLTEALEKEKLSKELRSRSESFGDHSISSNISHDLLKLRKEVAVLKEDNRLLKIDNDRWIERLKEQEAIVLDLKDRLGRNTSGYGEIEEVFGRQLALLQKQREELVNKLKDKEYEFSSLSLELGEKGIIEESLRKDKSILMAKLEDREKLEKELHEKKLQLEKERNRQRELEDVIYRKDMNEIELMKQKRLLEAELKDIESKFKDKEENLDVEKNKLLDELREKTSRSRSLFSESDDDASTICSESGVYSDRNIGRLEIMLEEVERQHSVAVNILKDQLRTKYRRREKELRKEHAEGLAKLKQVTDRQVN